jgi:hypothetical protein
VSTVFGITGGGAFGIDIDSLDNVYIANSGAGNVTKINQLGNSFTLGATGSNPAELVIDSLGNVYTANYFSNNVTKITQ